MPDRPKLHHQIRNEFSRTLVEFYRANPERLKDPNLENDLNLLVGLMTRVLRHVDEFDVRVKDNDHGA